MISACILTKNDSWLIERVIQCIRPYVQEIIVADDHSTDDTAAKCTAAGAKVFTLQTNIGTEGFGVAANEMLSYATHEWILIVDSDELMEEAAQLQTLTRYPGKTAWALPRRKWEKYPTVREEYEAYPDWQVRFFKNTAENKFEGQMHVRFVGDRVYRAYRGPHIEHLQQECRTPEKEKQRQELYEGLAATQGVKIVGGKLKELEHEKNE